MKRMTKALTRLRERALRNMARARADLQPWRCVACNEPVNKTTKRDCACTRALGGIP